MYKFLLIVSVFLMTPFALKGAWQNNQKMDFWTNTIDEILIRFRFNKLTNQLEMQLNAEDVKGKHLNNLEKNINVQSKETQFINTQNSKQLNNPNTKDNKLLDAIKASETTSQKFASLETTAKPSISQSTSFPTPTTINPLSIDSCKLNCSMTAPHIACGHNWSFSSSCSATAEVINLDDLQPAILYIHNNLRNHLAGNLTKFEPATRMATTQWHTELADYAELNVRQCNDEHDLCHRTKDFHVTGQNLAFFSWTGHHKDLKTILIKMISDWYNEQEYASQIDMDEYSSNTGLDNNVISHFTAIVNEKNTHIGCSAVSEIIGPQRIVYFACNYARNNIFQQAIYEKGETASKCLTGTNPEYENLCSINEQYDHNK